MQPISLDLLFNKKIFRIPDYQRGYAWQIQQLKDFWEDLVNLYPNRSHYTWVVTLKEIPNIEIKKEYNEFWLINEHSYIQYDVIDWQQRLTTCVIFLQSLIEFIRGLDENNQKPDNEIYISETLTIKEVIEKYLYKEYPTWAKFKTYIFGYNNGNPSYEYMKYKILWEDNPWKIDETFYTLNLKNAKKFFTEQLNDLYNSEKLKWIQDIYKKITKNFLFNEYIIKDEFDVFVAFETMNNRWKNLSKLELLKNRLIYLTTLFDDNELDPASRSILREDINKAWMEVYFQLWRNDKKPLNDDDFLKAHWIITFKYSRSKWDDYIKFLLDNYFSPKRIYKKYEKDIIVEIPVEQHENFDIEEIDIDFNNNWWWNDLWEFTNNKLKPDDIKKYVNSLKSFAIHRFNSYYPNLSNELTQNEKEYIEKLNRIWILFFRPLIVSILKNVKEEEKRIDLFKRIERFIFISFRLSRSISNYWDSEFYNASRELDKKEITVEQLIEKINEKEKFNYNSDWTFKVKYFHDYMYKKFTMWNKWWYYNWNWLQYFLYEYELEKMKKWWQKKVDWDLFIKNEKDKLSIEHILPQTLTDYWKMKFCNLNEDEIIHYTWALWNLLLLSRSINSSLQNSTYEEKVNSSNQKWEKNRMWYSDWSHSEIEVSKMYKEWDKNSIKDRWLILLNFLEKRWNININDNDKKSLLF